MLGDNILTDAAGHYNYFKKLKDSTDPGVLAKQLYMENMYAIRIVSPGVYTSKQAKNTPNIILNSLVDTLNTKAKVPHTLVILMNDYRFWNNKDLLDQQMNRILHRFLREIRRIVEARNLSLPPRAVNWDYPRIFLSLALPLPNNMTKPYPKGFKANRKAYNQLLQEEEDQLNYHSISMASFSSENENNLFSEDGVITQKGYRAMWTMISDTIHKSDNQIRIEINKARAKHLAAQMTSMKSEAQNKSGSLSDSDVSEIDCGDRSRERTRKVTKRALIDEFNSSDRRNFNQKSQPDSPSSTIVNITQHAPFIIRIAMEVSIASLTVITTITNHRTGESTKNGSQIGGTRNQIDNKHMMSLGVQLSFNHIGWILSDQFCSHCRAGKGWGQL